MLCNNFILFVIVIKEFSNIIVR